VDSVSTFCVLGRHALVLSGVKPAEDRREMVRQLAKRVPADLASFESLLDIRESKKTMVPGAVELFAQYLVSIGKLVVFVDGIKHG
jgi:hypothetical protein